MNVSDEMLMAFADGQLDGEEQAAVTRALEADAGLRAKLEAHRNMRARLSAAFDGALSEPVPARLQEAAQARPTATVVDLSARRAAKWSVREWGAMAASLAGGLIIGLGAMNARTPAMLATTEDGLFARGALARALDTQLAADDAGAVRIGLSFRNTDGDYCRTFDLTEAATAGLACKRGDGWAVAMTAAGAGGGEVRTAGASEDILAAVDTMIAGDPLDAAGEAEARDAGWR